MIVTRFPPSPTGDLHIGGVRTALYNWLMVRKHAGDRFILRIEDTDVEREKADAVAGIIEGLRWLGLNWDEGPIFQTDRYARYQAVADELVANGHAYYCYCSKERLDSVREAQTANKEKPRYDGHCRDNPNAKIEGVTPAIRFKNPQTGEVSWDDLVHGKITFQNSELDDLIIMRPSGVPTYNFCVVVDDMDMGVTHIVRGDDHINNTPRQINIFKALNYPVPALGHIGMILGDDGKKLSKRHGASSILAFREAGYLPQALLNYLVRLGWSHGDQEIFSLQEMIESFDIKEVNKSASTFNTEKLNWLNQHYLKTLPAAEIVPALKAQYEKAGIETGNYPLENVIKYYAERAKTLVEMVDNTRWLFEQINFANTPINKKAFHEEAKAYLTVVNDKLETITDWQTDVLHQAIADCVASLEVGFGKVGMPLRFALTGGKPSPNLEEILWLLGKEKSLAALKNALAYLSA